MQDLIIILCTVTALSVVSLIAVGVLWLQRWRSAIVSTLAETANQNIRTAQRLGEAIAQIQKQQRNYEEQINNLAQTSAQLRQGLMTVATRLDHSQQGDGGRDHTVH